MLSYFKTLLNPILLTITILLSFYILIKDILHSEEYHLDLTDGLSLTVLLFLFFILFIGWLKDTNEQNSYFQAQLIFTTTIFFSFFVQKFAIETNTQAGLNQNTINPFYKQAKIIASENNLDITFIKKITEKKPKPNFKVSNIYTKNKKSLDVLILGDSTIAWGLIPDVIQQKTKKEIGMYAFESNRLSLKGIRLFKKVINYYLKENGLLIIAFDTWTLDDSANAVSISKKEINEMLKWSDDDFELFAANYREKEHQPFYSFSGFNKKVRISKDWLSEKLNLRLKSPNIYQEYIEKKTNPLIYKERIKNSNKDSKFIVWDKTSITIAADKIGNYSITSAKQPKYLFHQKGYLEHQNFKDNKAKKNKMKEISNLKKNAAAITSLGPYKTMYVVPFYSTHKLYMLSRNIYHSFYEDKNTELCDLGVMHPENVKYPMAHTHMANEGGLIKSLYLAECISQNTEN